MAVPTRSDTTVLALSKSIISGTLIISLLGQHRFAFEQHRYAEQHHHIFIAGFVQ
jgi:hypothetical protein